MKQCLKKNMPLIIGTLLLSLIVSIASVFIAVILRQIIDIALLQDMEGFKRTVIISILYLTGYGLLYILYSLLSKVFIRNLNLQLRERVFKGIFRKNYSDFTNANTADYISALTNDIKQVEENFLSPLLLIIQYGVMFIFSIVLLFYYSPIVTLSLFISMLLMFIAPGLFGKALQSKQDKLSEKQSVFTGKIKDMFSGYEVIRSFRMYTHINKRFDEQNKQLASAKFAADKLFVGNETLSQTLSYLTQFVSVFVAAYLLIKGNITAGTLVALIQLGGMFVQPMMMIIQNIPKIKGISPVIKRLDAFADYESNNFNGTKVPSFKKELTIKELNFSYNGEKNILDKINFTFEKGKKYAIVGTSGCGKTTLTKLLMGYYSDYSGQVLLDKDEMKQLDIDKFCQMFSAIHQNVYMFDCDIKENICLYEKYTKQELDQALSLSGVEKFLLETKGGLSYELGENGKNLSGGQRQRIAIARALIKKTPILILDEGTSAIDMQTAYDIESSLLAVDDLTLMTITHKMSEQLLGMYDTIIYMEDGRIVESGHLDALLSKRGGFFEFFHLKEHER